MSVAAIYLGLAVFFAIGTLCALIKARQVYFLVPLYFMLAWLTGELAFIHILWQVALTSVLAFAGVFEDARAQAGLGIFALSWLGLAFLHSQSMDTHQYFRAALKRALGDNYRNELPLDRQAVLSDEVVSRSWLKPFHFARDGVRKHTHVSYGDAGERNLLDVYQPIAKRDGPFPVLLQVHGGAWVIGKKEEQAKPLMYHMAQRGWVCVAINYRLSPTAAFPAHIIDVKKAIVWIKDNIAEFGGDPDFIAITGGSAGGHLSSLAALTPNCPEYQPGFEDRDTSVQAAAPFYGVFDFLDRYDIRPKMAMDSFLGKRVMQCTREENPELWDQGSPLSRVNADAPPFFVVQGTHDTLVWVEEARTFVSALQAVSEQPVGYAELPGAQHAFEIFHSVRTDHAVNGVADFLEWTHAHRAG
ncbi:MAG: alpha/beta hydrolase [Halieaceae bacterium]